MAGMSRLQKGTTSQCWRWWKEGKEEMHWSKAVGGYGIKGRWSGWWDYQTINMALPRDEMADVAADGVKKRDRSPSSEGGVKERADEGEYNHFTFFPILLRVYLRLCVSPFHHVKLCVFSASFHCIFTPFHHNQMKVFIVTPFHHCVSPFNHVKLCVFSAPLHHIHFTIAPY